MVETDDIKAALSDAMRQPRYLTNISLVNDNIQLRIDNAQLRAGMKR